MRNELPNIMSERIGYNPQLKNKFHRKAKLVLQILADDLELQPGTYDIRNNRGGIAVSGEVTLHHDHFYVQISQSCMGPNGYVLYRTCKGRQDYTGGDNRFATVNELLTLPFRMSLRRMIPEGQ